MGEGPTYFRQVSLWQQEPACWDQDGRFHKFGTLPQGGWTLRLLLTSPISISAPDPACAVAEAMVPYHSGLDIQRQSASIAAIAARRDGSWLQLKQPLDQSLLEQLTDQDGNPLVWQAPLSNPLRAVILRWQEQAIDYLPHPIEGMLSNIPPDCSPRVHFQPTLGETAPTLSPAQATDFYGSIYLQCQVPPTISKPSLGVELSWKQFRRRIKAPLDKLQLITWQQDGEWRTYTDQGQTDLSVFRHRPLRFLGDFSEYGLLEGHRFIGRPAIGTAPIRGLSGYGAPLILRRGPFDSTGSKERSLASSICNQGIVKAADIQGGEFRIELHQSGFSPDPVRHQLLFWDGHRICLRPYASVGQLPNEVAEPLLVAVAYAKPQLACEHPESELSQLWWLGGCWTKIKPPARPSSPVQAAHLIRWAHMPVLQYRWGTLARSWLNSDPYSYVLTWSLDSRPTDRTVSKTQADFAFGHPADEGWWVALASLLPADLQLNPEQAKELLEAPWSYWLRVHPRLLIHLLHQSNYRQEIEYLRRTLADRGDRDNLWSQAEYEMGVDRAWIESTMQTFFAQPGTTPLGDSGTHLKLALAFPTFQKLILRTLLD